MILNQTNRYANSDLVINRCYDSHVHLAATGKIESIINFRKIKNLDDLKNTPIGSESYQGSWLLGFGWDQFEWHGEFMNRSNLDRIFKENPVCFTRTDGHAAVVNTAALKAIDIFKKDIKSPIGGHIQLAEDGYPTGLLVDSAKMLVDYKLPRQTKIELKTYLKKSQKIFNQQGFTHVRDMSSSVDQWEVLQSLIDSKDFTLAVEHNFTTEGLSDIDRAIDDAKYCKKQNSNQLRVDGIKIYLDGALGSSGAALTQNYEGESQSGLLAWQTQDLSEAFKKIWSNNLAVSIHGIGNLATQMITQIALDLKKQNIKGKLNLEHAQMLSDDSIKKLKELNVICYMQPCHWLSDKKWLKQKLGSLYKTCFRWADLEINQIPFYFGSDSPIEYPSIQSNFDALIDAQNNDIKLITKSFEFYHTHPDPNFIAHTHSHFSNGKISTFWMGEKIV